MIERVWDYCNKAFDNHGYIPDTEEVTEALQHDLTADEMDDAHNTIHDFIAAHNIKRIRVDYDGEGRGRVIKLDKKCACHHREIEVGEIMIVENGFYYCSKKDLINMIKGNAEHFADMLFDRGIAETEEAM
ncbi:hypothetical protein LRR81_08845 [Metabacillus sp. GX 13764]|uniref:hypothetical protein n=1 Tax=Metabacillus kandeliae TaxID=2900151 RepID=UPI001E5C7AD9|nr:hypothetical protein [Metabacillus kandeliae]MCD7034341.1 hypothetical protein [Metabacillus kandeliae]